MKKKNSKIKFSKNKKIKKKNRNISKKKIIRGGGQDDGKVFVATLISYLTKIVNENNDTPPKENKCPDGKQMGKSAINVKVCDDDVTKKIKKNIITDGIIEYNDDALKVTPSIMFIIQQMLSKKLVENQPDKFLYNGLPLVENYKTMFSENEFIGFNYTTASAGTLTNKLPTLTKEQLFFIIKTVFETNNEMYDAYQFQHCDMKCDQILLNVNDAVRPNAENYYIPIISDFDKSTCTININGTSTRIVISMKGNFGEKADEDERKAKEAKEAKSLIASATSGNDEEKEKAAGALRSLALNDDNKVAIAKAGGIESLIEPADKGTATAAKSAEVKGQEETSSFIKSKNTGNKVAVECLNIKKFIKHYHEQYKNNPHMCEPKGRGRGRAKLQSNFSMNDSSITMNTNTITEQQVGGIVRKLHNLSRILKINFLKDRRYYNNTEIQEYERYQKKPLFDNHLYNACLLSSVLLQCTKEQYDYLIQQFRSYSPAAPPSVAVAASDPASAPTDAATTVAVPELNFNYIEYITIRKIIEKRDEEKKERKHAGGSKKTKKRRFRKSRKSRKLKKKK